MTLTYQEGTRNGHCKTTLDTVFRICELLESRLDLSYRQIAIKTRASFHTVHSIALRRTWRRISAGFHWPARTERNKRFATPPKQREQKTLPIPRTNTLTATAQPINLLSTIGE